jgi:hypothetical protein
VLLTRSPLYSPEGFRARLACLIHTANVHSEPGSNPSKSLSGSWIFGSTALCLQGRRPAINARTVSKVTLIFKERHRPPGLLRARAEFGLGTKRSRVLTCQESWPAALPPNLPGGSTLVPPPSPVLRAAPRWASRSRVRGRGENRDRRGPVNARPRRSAVFAQRSP